jgi:Lrp/AsnC family transcriptional regulator, regulator for asnA, asnC and gidA
MAKTQHDESQRPPGPDVLSRAPLDALDRQIIGLLREDGRRSIADLARQAQASEPTIRKHLDRLLSTGMVFVTAYVPPAALGFPTYLAVAVTVEPGRLEEVGERIARLDEVEYVAYIMGGFDIFLEAHVVDRPHTFGFLTRDLGGIAGIRSVDSSLVLGIEKHTRLWGGESVGTCSGPVNGGVIARRQAPALECTSNGRAEIGPADLRQRARSGNGHSIELDRLDRRLIQALRIDGRARVSDIARSVGSPAQTVRNRMDRLIGQRVVTVLARVNPEVIGFPIQVLGRLRVRSGSAEKVARQLAATECVAFVAHLSGTFDLYMEAHMRDEEMLLDFVNHDIGGIGSVEHVQMHHVLGTLKRNFVVQRL